jgi:hypothetical protein
MGYLANGLFILSHKTIEYITVYLLQDKNVINIDFGKYINILNFR